MVVILCVTSPRMLHSSMNQLRHLIWTNRVAPRWGRGPSTTDPTNPACASSNCREGLTIPCRVTHIQIHAQPDAAVLPQDGVHYHFTAKPQMEKEIADGQFLEHAHVHGNIYGTSVAAVREVAANGKCCILDIDVQGARQVRSGSGVSPAW